MRDRPAINPRLVALKDLAYSYTLCPEEFFVITEKTVMKTPTYLIHNAFNQEKLQ